MTALALNERLLELADRVAAATGPCRKLDADICELIVLPACQMPDCSPDVLRTIIARTREGDPWDQDPDCPFYTASLDAAMTLTSPYWAVCANGDGDGWQAMDFAGGKKWFQAATPALALTAAALRAIAEQGR